MKGLARLTMIVVVWESFQGLHGQAPAAPDPLLDAYLSQEHSVTIDGSRRIHLVCMGAGTPTVVLSAGRGDWSVTWSRVQPMVATITRVCAWTDRDSASAVLHQRLRTSIPRQPTWKRRWYVPPSLDHMCLLGIRWEGMSR